MTSKQQEPPAPFIRLEGPVENQDGDLALWIPLRAGGDKLALVTEGISTIVGDYLKVTIQPWLAEKMGVVEGSTVIVDNENGKFNIYVNRPDVH